MSVSVCNSLLPPATGLEFEKIYENLKSKIEKVPKNLCKCLYMSLTTCHLLIDMIPEKFMGDTLHILVAKM
jgi:hypothetical protein